MNSRVLAPLALALVYSAPLPQQRAQEPALHARCIWNDGNYQAALDGLMLCGEEDRDARDRALAALEEHAQRHGWCGRIGGHDMIAPEANVRCPAQTLDLFVQITAACAEGEATWVQREFADVLARNGRVDEALTVLNFGAFRRPAAPSSWDRGFLFGSDRSSAAFEAANIAANAGRWEEAIEFSQEWSPSGGCGNCMAGQESRMNLFRVECLVHLQRWPEVRVACIDGLQDEWTSNPCLAEAWIDSYVLSGEASDPETAIAALMTFVEPRRRDEVDGAMQHWKLLHESRAQQMQHLAELADWHSDAAVGLLLDADPETLDRSLAAFELEGDRIRNYGLAYALISTGLPVVGDAIARARDASGREDLKYMRERWESAHEQRELLANQ